ncbi:hypothetical protein [Listeria booriae]|uniref:hypothetical protein n=1 Tax=Listeria booriae TaxID=1552123 RepID=UPI00162471F3|nr:hypothetical protein [Listeria booriae]MBC1235184.1 hypothetical protein [Listeria booriae]
MIPKTFEQDFENFCSMRLRAMFEDEVNHKTYQEKSAAFYQVRDQMEEQLFPAVLPFLDELEKLQVETFTYIYSVAFKEGLQFSQNK